MGFAGGFVLALAVVFLFYFMDNTITNGDAFKNRIDLPVLGEIPNYESDGKGGDKNAK
jgi:capsular polysaccharide biosynthesis protein